MLIKSNQLTANCKSTSYSTVPGMPYFPCQFCTHSCVQSISITNILCELYPWWYYDHIIKYLMPSGRKNRYTTIHKKNVDYKAIVNWIDERNAYTFTVIHVIWLAYWKGSLSIWKRTTKLLKQKYNRIF